MNHTLNRIRRSFLASGILIVVALLLTGCGGSSKTIADTGMDALVDSVADEGIPAVDNQNTDVGVDMGGADTGSGSVSWTDPVSGLVWQASDYQYVSWQDAIDYCDGLSLDGHDDWRLPNIGELRTLIRGCPATMTDGACGIDVNVCLDSSCKDNSCDGCGDGNGPDDEGCYWPDGFGAGCVMVWSSSPATGGLGENAWHVNFNDGRVNTDRQMYANIAVCMRN